MKCKICNKEFKSLSGLSIHLSQMHKLTLLEYKVSYENFILPKCECGQDRKQRKALAFDDTCGSIECFTKNRSKIASIACNNEQTKEKIRNARINYLKTNPNNAWRLGNKQSWPEIFFEKACERAKLNLEHQIIREYSIFPYYIDFAFIDNLIAVEVDGSQHNEPNRKKKDEIRDAFLNDKGWKVFRIPADKLYNENDADKVIDELKAFLQTSNLTNKNVGFISNKQLKDNLRLNQKNEKKHKELHRIDYIRQELLKSDIDFSKFGWVNKASIIIGIKTGAVNRWMKRNMLDFYNNFCFKRKPSVQDSTSRSDASFWNVFLSDGCNPSV